MNLLETYLQFIQEKEWDEDPGNADAFDHKLFGKVIGGPDSSIDPFNAVRHDLDTNYFDIYMKNMLGDYKGRTNTYNVTSDKMPFGKNDAIKVVKQIKKDYDRISTEKDEDDEDNARFKAKPRLNKDEYSGVRDEDNANIIQDGDDDGIGNVVGDPMGAPGGGGE